MEISTYFVVDILKDDRSLTIEDQCYERNEHNPGVWLTETNLRKGRHVRCKDY